MRVYLLFLIFISNIFADERPCKNPHHEHLEPLQKPLALADDAEKIEARIAVDKNCHQKVKEVEAEILFKGLERLNQNFLSNDHYKKVDELLEELNPENDPEKAAVLSAMAAQKNSIFLQSKIFPALMSHLAGNTLDSETRDLLEKIGIPKDSVDSYISDVSKNLKPHYDQMKKFGINFDKEKGWDFSNFDLTKKDLENGSPLKEAITQLISPEMAKALFDEERTEAIKIGNSMIFPFNHEEHQDFALRGIEYEEYQRRVESYLKIFNRETQTFINASRESMTYTNLMTGRLRSERGYKGKTAPEIERDSAYKSMITFKGLLRKMGIRNEMYQALNEATSQALIIESKHIESGLAKLDMAKKAAIAAPFIPLAIYAAPLAGGLVSAKVATAAGTASASLALLPMAFATGSAVIHSALDANAFGGDFFCYFAENFIGQSSSALYIAPFMASIPSGLSLLAAASPGALSAFGIGGVEATTAYGVLNISTAIGFVGKMGIDSSKELNHCYQLLQESKELQEKGYSDLSDIAANDAYKSCADGGIDLAFAIAGGRNLYKQAKGSKTTQKSTQPDVLNKLKEIRKEKMSVEEARLNQAGHDFKTKPEKLEALSKYELSPSNLSRLRDAFIKIYDAKATPKEKTAAAERLKTGNGNPHSQLTYMIRPNGNGNFRILVYETSKTGGSKLNFAGDVPSSYILNTLSKSGPKNVSTSFLNNVEASGIYNHTLAQH